MQDVMNPHIFTHLKVILLLTLCSFLPKTSDYYFFWTSSMMDFHVDSPKSRMDILQDFFPLAESPTWQLPARL